MKVCANKSCRKKVPITRNLGRPSSYCSDFCRVQSEIRRKREWVERQKKKALAKPGKPLCLGCKREFSLKTLNQVYCCDTCRIQALVEKHRRRA